MLHTICGVGESQMAELADGSLVFNGRADSTPLPNCKKCRAVAFSTDSGAFTEPWTTKSLFCGPLHYT